MTLALLQQGALVGDQWRLERRLGEGAMSSVWEAESLRLGSRVAIKFLAHQHLQDDELRRRFEREARAICEVRSQHVVQILDHGVSDGVPFLVMELLEGEDLGRMLEREGTVSLVETASIIAQLCRGLTKVHAAGFVHRDVKPENVFVIHENDGGHFIKLLDFGIAKKVDTLAIPLTQGDVILGTAHYLSPEQIEAPQQVDQRTDVWSVGVLTYRMLFGKLPFDGETWPALCARILAAELGSASVERPGSPADLDKWLGSAMQPNRATRFQTVEAASTALSSIARAHSTGMRKKSGEPHAEEEAKAFALQTTQLQVPPPSGRKRMLSAGLIALLLLGSGWLVWNATLGRDARVRVQPIHRSQAVPPRVEPSPQIKPEAPTVAAPVPASTAPVATNAAPAPARRLHPKIKSAVPAAQQTPVPKYRGF